MVLILILSIFTLPPILLIANLFTNLFMIFFIPASALVIGGDFNCYETALDKFGGNVSIGRFRILKKQKF